MVRHTGDEIWEAMPGMAAGAAVLDRCRVDGLYDILIAVSYSRITGICTFGEHHEKRKFSRYC
jgi:hypothetical protein